MAEDRTKARVYVHQQTMVGDPRRRKELGAVDGSLKRLFGFGVLVRSPMRGFCDGVGFLRTH